MGKILIFLLMLFAGLASAQTYNVTFPFDSGAVASDSIQFKNDEQWLAAIFVSDSLDIDSFYIQVCFDASANDTTAAGVNLWYTIYEGGAAYYAVGSESVAVAISMKPLALYPVNEGSDPREMWVRLCIPTLNAQAAPFNIKGITKTFE